ncbi:hypothetical protein HMI54_002486 [Coelomomyces lativittatus]|nr:hypothetical protein HMI56_003081 [Coelomomyces lativittatus]KAJ1509273.1 hypothetical protein HMI54_002486 [Coelomomyces lativittatus]KAJ1509934.1 hypothetical protein HMI55_007204 [Coelomomyces lativittatus]
MYLLFELLLSTTPPSEPFSFPCYSNVTTVEPPIPKASSMPVPIYGVFPEPPISPNVTMPRSLPVQEC